MAESKLYFPPTTGQWETVKPSSIGIDQAKLKKALAYAGNNQSSGVLILYRGKILAEQYWNEKGVKSERLKRLSIGRDKAGRAIEDAASVQKSVAAALVCIVQQKDLLKIEDRVDKYLGKGWSKASPQQESAITIRHLITMTSGLSDRGVFDVPAGSKWRYNTGMYAKTMAVLEKASGMDRHELTRKWLTDPLGMADSKWVKRGFAAASTNGYGFATTARDLARFGLMMQAKGKWREKAVLSDHKFLKDATTSSQKQNPYYGYLWWLNKSTFSPNRLRVADAPKDMFSANGALNRRCFVVPSKQLVITRLGISRAMASGLIANFGSCLPMQ